MEKLGERVGADAVAPRSGVLAARAPATGRRSRRWPSATGASSSCTATACSARSRTPRTSSRKRLLRAWRRRESFRGRSTLRAWLYGIATNACLDALERRCGGCCPDMPGRRDPASSAARRHRGAWLEPYPDRLLDEVAAGEPGPRRW